MDTASSAHNWRITINSGAYCQLMNEFTVIITKAFFDLGQQKFKKVFY
jgi:hypothetical protein